PVLWLVLIRKQRVFRRWRPVMLRRCIRIRRGPGAMESEPMTTPAATRLLTVENLSVAFPASGGDFQAVRGLDFKIESGKTLAIVGESGSGKSVTSMALMRLLDYTPGQIVSGRVMFDSDAGPIDMARASSAQIRRIRGNEISMIFQEPMTSLDPVFPIGSQVMEALILHQHLSRAQARKRAHAMLEAVRMPNAGQVLD